MPFLSADAKSHYKYDVIYARAGDQVTIISDSDNVLIVEGPDGNRFPVLRVLVSDIPVPKSDTLLEQVIPPVPVPPPKKAAVKKKSSVPSRQTNLF